MEFSSHPRIILNRRQSILNNRTLECNGIGQFKKHEDLVVHGKQLQGDALDLEVSFNV